MRRLTSFSSGGATLVATLDEADGAEGFLIVAGGRQTRIGPHRLFERTAHALAAAGRPSFRFDRQGVGDSDGRDGGYLAGVEDIVTAAAEFRRLCPQVETLTAVGLCDGATAAAIAAPRAGFDRLVLLNPWVVEPVDDLPPRAAIAATYRARLTDPAAWRRLAAGGIDLRKAARGFRRLLAGREDAPLFDRLAAAAATLPTTVVLAEGDATAQAFAPLWSAHRPPLPAPLRIDSASHSFAGERDFAALLAALLPDAYSAASASTS